MNALSMVLTDIYIYLCLTLSKVTAITSLTQLVTYPTPGTKAGLQPRGLVSTGRPRHVSLHSSDIGLKQVFRVAFSPWDNLFIQIYNVHTYIIYTVLQTV